MIDHPSARNTSRHFRLRRLRAWNDIRYVQTQFKIRPLGKSLSLKAKLDVQVCSTLRPQLGVRVDEHLALAYGRSSLSS